ncbi:MAG: hypothetical protein ACKOSS_04385 [Planctomycetia bacterium]
MDLPEPGLPHRDLPLHEAARDPQQAPPQPRPTLLDGLPLGGGILLSARARQQAHEGRLGTARLLQLLEQPDVAGDCRRRGRQWAAVQDPPPGAVPGAAPGWLVAVVQPSAHGLLVLRVQRRRHLPEPRRPWAHAPHAARARSRQRLLARARRGA